MMELIITDYMRMWWADDGCTTLYWRKYKVDPSSQIGWPPTHDRARRFIRWTSKVTGSLTILFPESVGQGVHYIMMKASQVGSRLDVLLGVTWDLDVQRASVNFISGPQSHPRLRHHPRGFGLRYQVQLGNGKSPASSTLPVRCKSTTLIYSTFHSLPSTHTTLMAELDATFVAEKGLGSRCLATRLPLLQLEGRSHVFPRS